MKAWHYLPANLSHALGPQALKIYTQFLHRKTNTWQPFEWRGLHFTNRLGVAGGFDKNAELVESLWRLGAGFVEIGTVTPYAQKPNLGKTIDRDLETQSLWNALGFPNKGAEKIHQNLRKISRPYHTPIFLNVGKNRHTSNESAHKDYIQVMTRFSEDADAFVVNISSPNTKDLRDLLKKENLENFLKPICDYKKNTSKPTLLKISPDITESEMKSIVDSSARLGIDGWILTNTTRNRDLTPQFPEYGGVSGAPLKAQAERCLNWTTSIVGKKQTDYLIISVGGVFEREDILKRLDMGAHLIQVYTALVHHGPQFFNHISSQLGSR